jgi:hypothetical protein
VRWLDLLSQLIVDMEARSGHRDEVVPFFFLLVLGAGRREIAAT